MAPHVVTVYSGLPLVLSIDGRLLSAHPNDVISRRLRSKQKGELHAKAWLAFPQRTVSSQTSWLTGPVADSAVRLIRDSRVSQSPTTRAIHRAVLSSGSDETGSVKDREMLNDGVSADRQTSVEGEGMGAGVKVPHRPIP
jgi:hypothetical protein